jgi:hypothetical protein
MKVLRHFKALPFIVMVLFSLRTWRFPSQRLLKNGFTSAPRLESLFNFMDGGFGLSSAHYEFRTSCGILGSRLGSFLDPGRLDGQCRLFLPLFCAMVRHGETGASGGSGGFLVAEPGRFAASSFLRDFLRQTPRHHFRVCLHVDSLHAEFDHPRPSSKSAFGLRGMRENDPGAIELLPALRDKIGGYFRGAVVGDQPYFFKTGWKAGFLAP